MENTRETYLNITEALGRLMGNNTLYIRMLKSFVNKSNFAELTDALEKADFQTATLHAHTIKGVAANLSFPDLYQKMQILEGQLKSGQTEGFSYAEAKISIENTLQHINAVIAENA